jgi:sugar phosphate isomerase/epimerase
MTYSRRQFNKLALTSLPAAAVALSTPSIFAADKVNSKVNGVQIGTITAYSYHNMPNDIDSIFTYLTRDGISATEMECPMQEIWAGAPPAPPRPYNAATAGGGRPPVAGAPRQRPQMTPEQIAAQKAHADEMTKWRTTMDIKKYVELRKKFEAAGIWIYGFKLGLNNNMPDAEWDYAFNAAKACGANQLTMEMPDGDSALTAKIGKWAEKHKLMVGYHAHLQAKPDTWDEAMSQSPWNGINIDIGHYTAAGNHDAVAFVKKNHAKITSLHLKDRKFPENGGQNMPWGQGDTPIKEVLQLMKKEGYKFPATIELEYPVPEGSDSEKEVVKCLAYAKAALA